MMGWLDRATGGVSMYRVTLIALSTILVFALGLSFTGMLYFGVLELLATAAVAVASSTVSSLAFARALGLRAHLESSLITGMLLLFLFWPSLDPLDLATVAIAGGVAGASKFLLAVQGRHVFNPTATGACVAGLMPWAFPAAWWVATPALLPLVAVGAIVVLQRTRRVWLGALFVGVSGVAIALTFLAIGRSPADAVWTALASYPIIFLAGFMLSEPLTLPPRKWQQASVAVIVAILLAVPFSIGWLSSSPEFALLIGNAVAFLFGQRKGIRLRFLDREQLTATSQELSFQASAPMRFRAGQYLELDVPHSGVDSRGTRRSFTIASWPGHDSIRIGVRFADPSSSFKSALANLRPGDSVRANWIGGDFVLPKKVERPLLLVAGGIGITPFISQLGHSWAKREKRDIVLVFIASRQDDAPYADRLAAAGVPALVVGPAGTLPDGWRHIGEALTPELLATEVPDAATRECFVSGAPALVRDTKAMLRRLGTRRVHTDYFTGY